MTIPKRRDASHESTTVGGGIYCMSQSWWWGGLLHVNFPWSSLGKLSMWMTVLNRGEWIEKECDEDGRDGESSYLGDAVPWYGSLLRPCHNKFMLPDCSKITFTQFDSELQLLLRLQYNPWHRKNTKSSRPDRHRLEKWSSGQKLTVRIIYSNSLADSKRFMLCKDRPFSGRTTLTSNSVYRCWTH